MSDPATIVVRKSSGEVLCFLNKHGALGSFAAATAPLDADPQMPAAAKLTSWKQRRHMYAEDSTYALCYIDHQTFRIFAYHIDAEQRWASAKGFEENWPSYSLAWLEDDADESTLWKDCKILVDNERKKDPMVWTAEPDAIANSTQWVLSRDARTEPHIIVIKPAHDTGKEEMGWGGDGKAWHTFKYEVFKDEYPDLEPGEAPMPLAHGEFQEPLAVVKFLAVSEFLKTASPDARLMAPDATHVKSVSMPRWTHPSDPDDKGSTSVLASDIGHDNRDDDWVRPYASVWYETRQRTTRNGVTKGDLEPWKWATTYADGTPLVTGRSRTRALAAQAAHLNLPSRINRGQVLPLSSADSPEAAPRSGIEDLRSMFEVSNNEQ